MGISEDELATALIQFHRRANEEMSEEDDVDYELEVHPEAHYNHYGNRGAADLFVQEGDGGSHVYELKSEFAIEEASGANEIIRQFNKMREFFFPGSSHEPENNVMFELCFTPSERTLRHLSENAALYHSAIKNDISGLDVNHVLTIITIRQPNPEEIMPIHVFTGRHNLLQGHRDKTFAEGVKSKHPEIYAELESVIHEVSE